MAQVLKEEVRNRILEAAEKVFYKKDYRGAKLTEIAKEAVPKGLLHQFFRKCPYTYCACYIRMN